MPSDLESGLDCICEAGAELKAFEDHTMGQWAELLLVIEAQGWELAERLDDERPS